MEVEANKNNKKKNKKQINTKKNWNLEKHRVDAKSKEYKIKIKKIQR